MRIDLALERRRNRRIGPCAMLAAACLASALPSPASSRSLPKPGATASDSVRISVSVAPRYGLASESEIRGVRGLAQGGEQFCMATNGPATILPVMIIWPSSQAGSSGTGPASSTLLAPCGTTQLEADAAASRGEGAAVQAVIIRPE